MPGKRSFARCVEKVSRRGGADDPRAVCAASKIKAGEQLNPIRAAQGYNVYRESLFGDSVVFRGNKTDASRELKKLRKEDPDHKFYMSVSRYPVYSNSRRNPLDESIAAYEDTHGHPPDKELVFVEEEHYHGFLPAWGQLISMVIVPCGQRKGVELKGFKGALLCFSEQYKETPQLHIVGGDQSVDTRAFGIATNHEYETLGKCADIVYATLKTHLGSEGGDADYVHAFAEESAGKNKHVRIRLSPDVIYDRLNEKLKFSGGVYEITPEGIRD